MPEGWFLDALSEKYRQGAQRADAATLAAQSDAVRAKANESLAAAQEADLRQKIAFAAQSRDLDTWDTTKKSMAAITTLNNASALDKMRFESERAKFMEQYPTSGLYNDYDIGRPPRRWERTETSEPLRFGMVPSSALGSLSSIYGDGTNSNLNNRPRYVTSNTMSPYRGGAGLVDGNETTAQRLQRHALFG